MIPFPDKKYSIIYADPPWSYSDSGCSVSYTHLTLPTSDLV